MATLKQLAANRNNALASSGPHTAVGKAISAQNARTHGLLARDVVAKGESRKRFEALRASLLSSLGPVGELETLLVERIAACAWRLQRAARIETESFAPVISYSSEHVWSNDENSAPKVPDHFQVGCTDKDGDTETVVVDHYQDEADCITVRLRSTNRSVGHALSHRRNKFECVSRYERAIENSLFRALHELQRLQATRHGVSMAVPAVLDVAVTAEPGQG